MLVREFGLINLRGVPDGTNGRPCRLPEQAAEPAGAR
jgi:hypothetical protein